MSQPARHHVVIPPPPAVMPRTAAEVTRGGQVTKYTVTAVVAGTKDVVDVIRLDGDYATVRYWVAGRPPVAKGEEQLLHVRFLAPLVEIGWAS